MLGEIADRLDDPVVAAALIRALDAPDLAARLAALSDGRPPADVMAATVRRFLDTASDEDWLRLVGIMSRAEDPTLAALRAILTQSLPRVAAAHHAG